MSGAVQSPLLVQADRFGRVLALSAAAHVVALVALLLLERPSPAIDLSQKPLVAKLVRLGEKRPEHLLPRIEEAPPPAARPSPVAVPSPAPPVKPAPSAPPAPPRPPEPAAAAPKPPPRSDAFRSALARVRRDVATQEPLSGSPQGSALGDASEGDVGDEYAALVKSALQEVYQLPATIPERERMHLRATVILYLNADGSVARYTFESRSGNPSVDDALVRAIREATIPPPPPELRKRYREQGLGVLFTP